MALKSLPTRKNKTLKAAARVEKSLGKNSKESDVQKLFSGKSRVKSATSVKKELLEATRFGEAKHLRNDIELIAKEFEAHASDIRSGRLGTEERTKIFNKLIGQSTKFSGDRHAFEIMLDNWGSFSKNRKSAMREEALRNVTRGNSIEVGGSNLMSGRASNRDVAGYSSVDSAGGASNRDVAGDGSSDAAGGANLASGSVLRGGRINSNRRGGSEDIDDEDEDNFRIGQKGTSAKRPRLAH